MNEQVSEAIHIDGEPKKDIVMWVTIYTQLGIREEDRALGRSAKFSDNSNGCWNVTCVVFSF